MTTSRVIRGTRAKIFLYLCAILIITGILACYNNTLSQLEDARKSSEICHQQEENLSTQLQVISDYKQRLEKSLKTEKAEHQQTKINLENKLNNEKNQNEKVSSEAKLKLSSLQQHFNLLQTEHDDFKEKCSKMEQKHHEDVNELDLKLKEIKEDIQKVKSEKESIKSQYIQLQNEKDSLEKQVNDVQGNKNDNESRINHLTKEKNDLKREINALKEKCSAYDTLPAPNQNGAVSSQKKFNGMSEVSPSLYAIRNSQIKPQDTNVLNMPPRADKQEKSVLAVPNSIDLPSSSKSTTKSGLKPSQGSLNGARPLLLPTVTPETIVNKNSVLLGVGQNYPKLPDGVVAVPEKKEDTNEIDQQEVVNNRYINVKEGANEPIPEKAVKEDIDRENGAHEVFDAPVPQNGFDGLAFGENEHIKHAEKQRFDKNHIDTLRIGEKKIYDQDQPEYNNLQNEVPLEDNEGDDEADDYDGHMPRQKEPAVRN